MATITSATVCAPLADVATATLAPAVTNGQSIPIDTEDWIILVQADSAITIADATKMTVNVTRPGYGAGTGSAAITRADTCLGVKQLRRAYPNQASALTPGASNAYYIAIDNPIKASDVVSSIVFLTGFFTGQVSNITITTGSVTRADAQVYEKPIIRPMTPPFQRFTTTATIEFAGISEWAAFGTQFARVEARGKINGSYGPWAGQSAMSLSVLAPGTGRNPSGLRAPCYSVTVDLSSLANSASRTDSMIVYRCYGWYGDVIFDSETDGDALGATGVYSSMNPPVGLPIIKDVVGNHTPIYAWVNRDGTTGGSAAIQTTTADPGAVGSYASENAAFVAARAWNNTNRTNPHNTTSGIVIMFRDNAGSLGDSTTSYWQRATMVGFSDGLLPPVLASATWLATGSPTVNCRRRGVQDDGVTAATSKLFSSIFEFKGLTIDSTGLTGANHGVFDGGTPGRSSTQVGSTVITIFTDCDIRENSGGGATPSMFGGGWQHHIRTDMGGLGAGIGVSTSGSVGTTPTTWSGTVLRVGCLVANNAWTARPLTPVSEHAVWMQNLQYVSQQSGAQADIEYAIMNSVRMDMASPTTAPFRLLATRPVNKGFGLCNVFVRMTGTYGGPLIQLGADGMRWSAQNFVMQHISVDGGFATNTDRINLHYGDQAYIQILKRGSIKYSGLNSYNIKDDIFPATEGCGLGSTATEGPWTATTTVYRGTLMHDGNATPSLRVWYQRLTTGVTGAVQATDLADTAAWLNLGLIDNTPYGAQPLRTGNWRHQHGVRNFGNVACRTANGDTVASPSSWYGEAWGRGGAINATWADYFKNRTGGTLSTFTTWGDYRPKSIAGGDAANSPMLSRVAANQGVVPWDIAGNVRWTSGSSAGAFERSDAQPSSGGALQIAGPHAGVKSTMRVSVYSMVEL